MLFIRSALFNTAFYLNFVIQMVVFSPFFFLGPSWYGWGVSHVWSKTNVWLLRVLAGAKLEIRDRHNMIHGPCIVAPKHQSFLDTFAFVPDMEAPLIILKRELLRTPLFGQYLKKFEFIAIDRGGGRATIDQIVEQANGHMASNARQLVIYPEGTRKPVGAEPEYRYGIVDLYCALNLPVVPIAHLCGLYWPHKRFERHPGIIPARYLPPIEPGLSRRQFFARLVSETEAACDEMLVETARGPNPPPMPATAITRLIALGEPVDHLERRLKPADDPEPARRIEASDP